MAMVQISLETEIHFRANIDMENLKASVSISGREAVFTLVTFMKE